MTNESPALSFQPAMKNSPQHVSLAAIAEKAFCSRATVSLALRDDPSIPKTTRDRIQTLAKRMNYQPNPYLSRLLAETARTRHGNRGAVIAYLDTQPLWEGWENARPPGFDAACQRAGEHGFKIDYFPLSKPNEFPKQLNKMLWTRGVAGLLIPALNYDDLVITGKRTLPIEWDKFCAVEIDDTMMNPVLNRVRHNHLSGIWKALDALEALGYRRIGLCLSTDVDLGTHHRWSAGYLLWRSLRRLDDLPLFLVKKFEAPPLSQWLRNERIEAVISPGTDVFELMREAGINVPGEIGFATLDAWGTDADQVSGINQRRDILNSMAVDLLVTLINRNSKGVPEHPSAWTYSGQWQEGATTRRVSDAPPPPPIEERFLDASQ